LFPILGNAEPQLSRDSLKGAMRKSPLTDPLIIEVLKGSRGRPSGTGFGSRLLSATRTPFFCTDMVSPGAGVGHAQARAILVRQVSHPNVCRVWDVGESNGQPFLAMEYVDGETLESLLRRIGRIPEERGVRIARELCAGLAAVHDQGLLHQDLKPSNVMLDG